ncbi:hypothetical protein BCR39DRAFT_214494 [Naematelia encephala]|uniref:Uncharacterized protein n=1 Tax=Naematelia encephala TaxID=71784 RepID=A0A1Y2B1U8_9TREE|nr:hypothetical protein BCR39DRAFT_214494 [Naematelia encephala]
MTVLTSVLGWQAFGVGVRLYQLKLQGRAITAAPHIYGYVLAGWAAFGYGVYRVERHQKTLGLLRTTFIESPTKRASSSLKQITSWRSIDWRGCRSTCIGV